MCSDFDFLVKSGDPPADWNPERVYFRRVSGVVVEVVGELRDWLKEKKKEREEETVPEKSRPCGWSSLFLCPSTIAILVFMSKSRRVLFLL